MTSWPGLAAAKNLSSLSALTVGASNGGTTGVMQRCQRQPGRTVSLARVSAWQRTLVQDFGSHA